MTDRDQQPSSSSRSYTSPRKRQPKGGGVNIELTGRDLSILYQVFLLRFMTSTQILVFLDIDPSSATAAKMRRRLRKLFDHKYLDRIEDPYTTWEKGSRPIIYALSDAGADVLAQPPFHVPRRGVYWKAKNKDVTNQPFIHHTLQTSAFMVNLHAACRRHGGVSLGDADMILANATQLHHRAMGSVAGWTLPYENKGKTENASLIPDRMFYIERDSDQKRRYFMLEIDRGTMPVRTEKNRSSIQRKIRLYWTSARHQMHKKHFGYEHFGVVLFVTTSDDRVANMMAVTREVLKGTGWRRVLFTTQDAIDSTVGAGGTLFDVVWTDAMDGEMVKLLGR